MECHKVVGCKNGMEGGGEGRIDDKMYDFPECVKVRELKGAFRLASGVKRVRP